MYAEGRGVEKNEETAVEWFTRAAEQNFPDAQYDLAEMYDLGHVVEKDEATAAKWYTRAANQEHFKAQCRLLDMYEAGYGVEKNEAEGFEWRLRASKISFQDKLLDKFECILHPIIDRPAIKEAAYTPKEILEAAEHLLCLYTGAVRNYEGSHFKEYMGDPFLDDYFTDAQSDVLSWIKLLDAFNTPGFFVPGIYPKCAVHRALWPFEVGESIYYCLGKENVQLSKRLLKLLDKMKDHPALRACIDHSESLRTIAPARIDEKENKMLNDLRRLHTNLGCLSSQLYTKIQAEALQRHTLFKDVYLGDYNPS